MIKSLISILPEFEWQSHRYDIFGIEKAPHGDCLGTYTLVICQSCCCRCCRRPRTGSTTTRFVGQEDSPMKDSNSLGLPSHPGDTIPFMHLMHPVQAQATDAGMLSGMPSFWTWRLWLERWTLSWIRKTAGRSALDHGTRGYFFLKDPTLGW
jgi:hypothetical protein